MSSTADPLPEAMQPIVCCLGERVAGKPTQFMWERAIAAGQLDWRAITIQLSSQDLPVALSGMYVMRIMGLRFYSSLQSLALQQLAADQERLQFIGRITSALRGPQSWQAWHNWGGAILAWGAQQANLSHATCWLHGDSVECRSLWVALLEGVAAGAPVPRTVLWTEPPANVTPRWEIGSEVQLVQLESEEQGLAYLQEQHGVATQAKVSPDSPSASAVLLVAGVKLPGRKPTVGSRNDSDSRRESHAEARQEPRVETRPESRSLSAYLAGSTVHCLVAGGAEAAPQAQSWSHRNLQFLSPPEQTVACEAYDFKRLTGCTVASHVLRDAYDEYHGFE